MRIECHVDGTCRAQRVTNRAADACYEVLDRCTLADRVHDRRIVAGLLRAA